MGLFQSEDMSQGLLLVSPDNARSLMEALGRMGCVQFEEMNEDPLVRPYRARTERLDDIESELKALYTTIRPKSKNKSAPKKIVKHFNEEYLDMTLNKDDTDTVEREVHRLHTEYTEAETSLHDWKLLHSEKLEEQEILEIASREEWTQKTTPPSVESEEDTQSLALKCLLGSVLDTDRETLRRLLYRISRGNCVMVTSPLTKMNEIYTSELLKSNNKKKKKQIVTKSAFSLLFQYANELDEKIKRICDVYQVLLVEPEADPEASKARQDALVVEAEQIQTNISALDRVLGDLVDEMIKPCKSGNSLIEEYRLFVLKERSLYATLNKFEANDLTMRCTVWYPTAEEVKLKALVSQDAGDVVSCLLTESPHEDVMPPTLIKTNQFQSAFQGVVNTYGIPRYKEMNPAIIAIVTFPFMFGIMYGDVGHGFLFLLLGLFLVYKYPRMKRSYDEMVGIIRGGRWMIVMMGFYAIYVGFLYNDYFAVGFDMLGTRYEEDHTPTPPPTNPNLPKEHTFLPRSDVNFPYPFGLDPVWKGATNELIFTNSFKMKFAIIMGLIHMTMGMILKLRNYIYFKQWVYIVIIWIPQMIFLWSLIGYLDFLLILKWVQPVTANKPKLVTALIDLVFFTPPTDETRMFNGQDMVQVVLPILAFISVPVMLVPKPIIDYYSEKKKLQSQAALIQKDKSAHEISSQTNIRTSKNKSKKDTNEKKIDESESEFSVSEVDSRIDKITETTHDTHTQEPHHTIGENFIHSVIETIEFCLGTISNTASYLRLWALSLAHQQLSLVFFRYTILLTLGISGLAVKCVALFIGHIVFAAITFGVMVAMEGLEAFLHSLRLQWVELQNKFYYGDGHLFTPFDLHTELSSAEPYTTKVTS